jgi:hypothetical protein
MPSREKCRPFVGLISGEQPAIQFQNDFAGYDIDFLAAADNGGIDRIAQHRFQAFRLCAQEPQQSVCQHRIKELAENQVGGE